MLIILTLGSSIFTDKLHDNFRCKNADEICTQACFNTFSSINPARFWKFQLVFLLMPVILFYAYVAKIVEKISKFKALQSEHDLICSNESLEKSKRKRVLKRELTKVGTIREVYGTREKFILDKNAISSAFMTNGIQCVDKNCE